MSTGCVSSHYSIHSSPKHQAHGHWLTYDAECHRGHTLVWLMCQTNRPTRQGEIVAIWERDAGMKGLTEDTKLK